MDPGVIIKLHVEPEEQHALSATCPLCRVSFEAASADPPPKALCPGCGLTFTPTFPEPEPDPGPDAVEPKSAVASPHQSADALDRWLLGEPIQPREITDAEWLKKWLGKHRVACGAATIAAIGLAVLSLASLSAWTYASWSLSRAVAARDRAEGLRQEAEAAFAGKSQQVEHKDSLWKAERAARQKIERRLEAARQRLTEAEQLGRAAESARLRAEREVRGAIAQHLAARSELIRSSHPEHSLLLAAEALDLTQRDGAAPIASAAQFLRERLGDGDGKYLRGHAAKIVALAISRNSRWLATAGSDNTTRVWDLSAADPAAAPLVLSGHQGRVSAVAFSPDNRWLATGSFDSTVCLWNLDPARPATSPLAFKGHDGRITNLAVRSDARWLFSASSSYNTGDSELRVWDLAAAEPGSTSRVLPGQEGRIQTIAISRNDRWLAAAGDDGRVRLWSLTSQGPQPRPLVLSGRGGRIGVLAFSANSRYLAAAASGAGAAAGAVWLWDFQAPDKTAKLTKLSGHDAAVRAIAASPDDLWLATGGEDGTVRLWDLTAANPTAGSRTLAGHQGAVLTVAFSSDNRWLVTGGSDQTVRVWTMGAGGPETTPLVLRSNQGPVDSLAISPDGHWLATAGDDHTARIWNLRWDELIDLTLKSGAGPNAERQSAAPVVRDEINVAERSLRLNGPQGEARQYR